MPKLVLYAAAAIIAAAALPLPYGIYVFIRIIGTITFACLAYESWNQGMSCSPGRMEPPPFSSTPLFRFISAKRSGR